MEGWWPQWKCLWACLGGSLSGHAHGQNNLLPHITWHRALFSIQVTQDLQLREGTATSCSCSCARRCPVEKRRLRGSLQNKIGAHSCQVHYWLEVPDPKVWKPRLPFWDLYTDFTLHTMNSSLNLSRCALCSEVKRTCIARRDCILSTNLLWGKYAVFPQHTI